MATHLLILKTGYTEGQVMQKNEYTNTHLNKW